MNEDNMRSVVIFGGNGFDVLESLKALSNWSFQNNPDQGHPYLLKNGETTVYLNHVASNVVVTSNVLPQDHVEQHPSFKDDALQRLVKDLDEQQISHAWHISKNDEKLL